MTFAAKILKDSVAPSNVRLTTWELTYPRFIHAEFMTHRLFSRNAASSRAIPIAKNIEAVEKNPALPSFWGKNQKGMQAAEELDEHNKLLAKKQWLIAKSDAIAHVKYLEAVNLHKQLSNRLLEPWSFITVIVTATNFSNFFKQRDHKDAQPEFRDLAAEMKRLYLSNTPQQLVENEWHLPLFENEDAEAIRDLHNTAFNITALHALVSAGRCARISYLTHAGTRDVSEDISLTQNKLVPHNHWSPLEHPAMAMSTNSWNAYCQKVLDKARSNNEAFNPAILGNIHGWMQYRKFFPEQETGLEFKVC